MMNSLIQECIDKDDVHKTIGLLSLFVYLNLSEDPIYSNINNTINVNTNNIEKEVENSSDLRFFSITGNIEDDELNIMKIRDLFEMISGLATMHQTQWITKNVEKYVEESKEILEELKSTKNVENVAEAQTLRKQQYVSIMSYNEYPYLKSFCQYQGELLTDIVGNIKADNRVYRSYFEDIVDKLMLIQPFISDSYLRKLYEFKIEELKRANNEAYRQIKQIDELNIESFKKLDESISRAQEIASQKQMIDKLINDLMKKLGNKSE